MKPQKLDTKKTMLVGLAFLSICTFWQIYDSIIPLILKNTFEISDTISGMVMAADNVLALVLLPVLGALSDRTHTRIGRRMPYILCGTAAAAVIMSFIPVADRTANLPLFAVLLCAVLLAMSTYRSPAVALMPDVTPKPLRSRANAIINLMGTIGGIIALGLIAVMVKKDAPNYQPLFLTVAVLMVACVTVLFLTVRENALHRKMLGDSAAMGIDEDAPRQEAGTGHALSPEVKKSLGFMLASIALWFMGYNAVTTAFSRYAQIYWGLEGGLFAYTLIVAQAAALIAYIPVGAFSSRYGRKKTVLLGVILLAVAFGGARLFRTFSPVILGLFAVAGVGWAAINVNSYPMVVEMSRGSDIGKYTGLYYSFSMAAQVVTPILSGWVLEHMGYGWLFPYATLFVCLAFVTMLFVRHGDSRPEAPGSKLEAFADPEDL